MVNEMQTISTWTLCFLLCCHAKLAEALKCYHCNNLDNPACGVLFKPYQFVAQPCQGHSSRDFKCVLQREPPTGKDDWVGIIRSCYEMGSLSVNETNGCHVMKIAGLTTAAKLCFCDTDYCNHAMVTWSPASGLAVVTSLVVSVLYHFVHPY
uniref:Uncharacterized protein LOC111123745 n=1 Tax=Crassostrea virginica TaxID=6565 RepID=A0A8B8D1R1_CRAVI|nr:uncharacterized protein LOC111123745 [Crassostrea virginica]XP_022322022.1 uncharacterized protein LOC111123745 [Crassostrea virginica]XP_022322030.1 uncharacterized protein LOC111123745 [Crassostrea virginica]